MEGSIICPADEQAHDVGNVCKEQQPINSVLRALDVPQAAIVWPEEKEEEGEEETAEQADADPHAWRTDTRLGRYYPQSKDAIEERELKRQYFLELKMEEDAERAEEEADTEESDEQ
jgi:hypothetical protein